MKAIYGIAALVLLTGCKGETTANPVPIEVSVVGASSEPPLRACSDVYVVGQTARAADTKQMCTDPRFQGGYLSGANDETCKDGRRLLANEYAWGYDGQPWQAYAAGEQKGVAPKADRDGCNPE